MESENLVIVDARLRDREGLWSISVESGRIKSIDRYAPHGYGERLDANGGLVTESHVIAHLHLDKVNTLELIGDEAIEHYHAAGMEGSSEAIRLASRVKQHYSEDDIYRRAMVLCEQAVVNGVTHIRAFADVDVKAKLMAVRALKRVKDDLKGRLEIQVVAFPQDGLVDEPLNGDYLARAASEGVDAVGGIPWIERDDPRREKHVSEVFDLAVGHGLDAAFLSDDAGDPQLRTTEMICRETRRRGWAGRVEVCHARAMALYPPDYLDTIARMLAELRISMVVNPHTGPLCAPVRPLLARGVNVALGQDDCSDAYYPYGQCKMLEVAFLASHLLHMMSSQDRGVLYEMITTRAAKAVGLHGHGVAVGCQANLNVYRESSLSELFRFCPNPVAVLRGGRPTYLSSASDSRR